jgi:hypothetical protein
VFDGVSACTTAVGVELDEAEPSRLVAVTATLIVEPTSLDFSRYVWLVAPEIDWQLDPEVLQSCH